MFVVVVFGAGVIVWCCVLVVGTIFDIVVVAYGVVGTVFGIVVFAYGVVGTVFDR